MAQLQNLFEQREKQIMEEVSRLAKDVARKELALMEFELFYSTMVSEEKKIEVEDSVNALRSEKWAKALERAHGKEDEALLIYDEI